MLNRDINIMSKEWQERYNAQTEEVRLILDDISNNAKAYQFKIIKRKRVHPTTGDVFVVNVHEDIYFYGLVYNSPIQHIKKDVFIQGKAVIFLFRKPVNVYSIDNFNADFNDLLIPPVIVDRSYWTRGYFYNIGRIDIESLVYKPDYGFYRIGIHGNQMFTEQGEKLIMRPKQLGMYGISTITGVSSRVNKELIINTEILDTESFRN